MLIFFAPLLAILGVVLVFRGREAGGLLVITTALVAVALVAAAYGRWPWTAFCVGMAGLCLVGIAIALKGP